MIYHVRFSLCDSIPARLRRELHEEKERLIAAVGREEACWTPREKQRLLLLYSEKVDRAFDAGYGACWLRDERLARVTAEALEFFNGQRYKLYAWCVMPNHVHVVVRLRRDAALPTVVHSWKSFTANEANKILGRRGGFWTREYFDRIMRDQEEVAHTIEYVHSNPELAGLKDWNWRFRLLEASELAPDRFQ
jgi:REP element-mobilizing transposase RayT